MGTRKTILSHGIGRPVVTTRDLVRALGGKHF